MEHQSNKHGKWDPTEDLMVPFEHYSFHASAFVIDTIANNSIPIVKFDVLGTLDNFVIRSHEITDMNSFTYEL